MIDLIKLISEIFKLNSSLLRKKLIWCIYNTWFQDLTSRRKVFQEAKLNDSTFNHDLYCSDEYGRCSGKDPFTILL